MTAPAAETASAEPVIDTHVHFWDLKNPSLTYGWLQPDAVHPILGNIDGIKSVRYEAEHWWAEARFSGVSGAVHVQAAVGTPDPVEETRWLTEMAAKTGQPLALLAHADLASADIEHVLDAHLESPLMRGVRDFAVEGILAAREDTHVLERGLGMLASKGLVLDLDCEWPNMAAASRLARRHPDLVIVLEHIGFPRRRDPSYFDAWRRGIDCLSRVESVHCKLSGIGMTDPRWTLASVGPWVEHCLEAFGPDRCMVGSNWPVDRLFSSYDAAIEGYRTLTANLSDQDRYSVLAGTARRVYRLPLDETGSTCTHG